MLARASPEGAKDPKTAKLIDLKKHPSASVAESPKPAKTPSYFLSF
jgi:hypothetical protein